MRDQIGLGSQFAYCVQIRRQWANCLLAQTAISGFAYGTVHGVCGVATEPRTNGMLPMVSNNHSLKAIDSQSNER